MKTITFLLTVASVLVSTFGDEFVLYAPELLSTSGESNYEPQRHRDLGWGWSSLLYHIGFCSTSSCPDVAGGPLCPCPDCSKAVPPPVRTYCDLQSYKSQSTSSYSAASYADESSDSASSYEADESSTSLYENYPSGSGADDPQDARWKWSMFMYLAGAAAVLTIGAVLAKRARDTPDSEAALNIGDDDNVKENTSAFSNISNRLGAMLGVGAAAGAAAAAATAGRGKSVSGSVARRLDALEGDEETTPYHASNDEPSFVKVPDAAKASETLSESNQGVEIEGPYRPSSNRFSPSNRYAV